MTDYTKNRHVLITGASRGLGRALARAYHRRGARVSLFARTAPDVEALASELGERCTTFTGDVRSAKDHEAALTKFRKAHGPVDVLINNAGIGAWKPLVEWRPQEVIDCVNLNLLAPMLLAQAVLPGMVARRGGIIVNIASDLARRPLANMAPYVASKFGLLGFSGSLLREAKAHGIKVSAVLT